MKTLFRALIASLTFAGLAYADSGDIPLSSNFQLNSGRALDPRTTVTDSTARNAIAGGQRYDGMLVYQRSDHHLWQIQGSTSNWVDITSTSGYAIYPSTSSPVFPGATITGSGAGQLSITEGTSSGVPVSTGKDVLWADSTQHTLEFNPNNTSSFTVVGSSITPTAGHSASWSALGQIIDSGFAAGSGGYNIYPATATASFPLGMTQSTGTYTSISTMTVTNVLVDATGGSFGLASKTIAQFKVLTPMTNGAGNIYACSDCASVPICVSTGTATGAWALITSKTGACQ